MNAQEVFDTCERVVSAVLEAFEKLTADDRKKVVDEKLCYAILERKRAPAEMQSSTQSPWIVHLNAEEKKTRIDWPFDADNLVKPCESLPAGEYRWRVYPVGNRADQFPKCRPNPLAPKGCEIALESGDRPRNGDSAGALTVAQMSGKGLVPVAAIRDIVHDVMQAGKEEREQFQTWYKEMHDRLMKTVSDFSEHARGVMTDAIEIATQGRLSQLAAFETHSRAIQLTRKAEGELVLAEELMEQAESMIEEQKPSGLAGVLMQIASHEDGRAMMGIFMTNLLEKIETSLKGGDKKKALDTVSSAVTIAKSTVKDDTYDDVIKRIPDRAA